MHGMGHGHGVDSAAQAYFPVIPDTFYLDGGVGALCPYLADLTGSDVNHLHDVDGLGGTNIFYVSGAKWTVESDPTIGNRNVVVLPNGSVYRTNGGDWAKTGKKRFAMPGSLVAGAGHTSYFVIKNLAAALPDRWVVRSNGAAPGWKLVYPVLISGNNAAAHTWYTQIASNLVGSRTVPYAQCGAWSLLRWRHDVNTNRLKYAITGVAGEADVELWPDFDGPIYLYEWDGRDTGTLPPLRIAHAMSYYNDTVIAGTDAAIRAWYVANFGVDL